MKVTTNNQPRPMLTWDELTPAQQNSAEDWNREGSFIPYKGWVYALEEFKRTQAFSPKWHGYVGDSAFSAVLIRIIDDESVIMATATW